MVASNKKWRNHCSTCGVVFDRPQLWAYCSKDCERGRRGLDRGDHESGVDSWLDAVYARRLRLSQQLDIAHNWPTVVGGRLIPSRAELQQQIEATHAEEAAMREQLASLQAPRTSALFWQPLVEREADRFETAMRRSVAAAIRLGKRLMEAKAALEHGEFGKLFADHPQAVEGALRISPRWARVLMAIAGNWWIANGKHASVLPADITSVHLLARLPEDELERAIAAGAVRPDMRREDVRRLLPADDAEPFEPDHEVVEALAPVREQLRNFLEQRPGCLRDVRAHLRELLRQIDAGGRNG